MSRVVMIALAIVVVLVVGLGLIQLVPYGRDHANPPVTSDPAWDSPATKALAGKACFDGHSNETVWPAYSSIAPGPWLICRDVAKGRGRMSFSEWSAVGGGGSRLWPRRRSSRARCRRCGTSSRTAARLSDAEKQQLIAGFKASAQ